MDIQKIGGFLKELRKQNNMTQEQLGEKLNEEDYKESAENNIAYTLEEIEAKEKKFENTMLIIMGITSLLAISSIFLLPNGSKLTVAEKAKEIVAVIFIWVMALISNTLSIIAIVSKKSK